MAGDAFRARVLRAHGAEGEALTELLAYTRNRFRAVDDAGAAGGPLEDEPSVAAWERYAALAQTEGVFACLRERLVQLAFPIARGISESEAYRAATRRGHLPAGGAVDGGLRLNRPQDLRLFLQRTPAGRIPVLVAGDRGDFESLLRALTRRNEPEPIPASVGATIVGGYNNWDRVGELRERWQAENPGGDWNAAFRALLPRKELYQDRFILLSRGAYSGASAQSMGLDEAEWLEASLTIRLEHECAHYVTRRVFGSMENALHDELIADYLGIVAVERRFRADWFLRFLGLEDFPACRPDGRLASYRGSPPLSDAAYCVLQSVMKSAADNVARADFAAAAGAWELAERARAVRALASIGVEEMAAEEGPDLLAAAWEAAAGG